MANEQETILEIGGQYFRLRLKEAKLERIETLEAVPLLAPPALSSRLLLREDNGANIPGLENIAGLEQLPEKGFLVVALPMKIAGGSSAPCRIVVLRDR